MSPSTLLADLVDTSQRVGAQASRRAKIAAIAELLRKLAPTEIEIGVSYLAGIMVINQAMATPKGRADGARYLAEFVEEMKASGFVSTALARHGVEGAAIAPPVK